MRKILTMVLALIMICGCAAAQIPGNLDNGGFVDTANGEVVLCTNDGIIKIGNDGVIKLSDDDASMLSIAGERIYYLKNKIGTDEYGDTSILDQTPMSMDLSGGDAIALGEARRVGMSTDYEEYKYDTFVGYAGFTVYADRIYYLANSGTDGTYTCNMITEDENGNETTQ
ncbi:MAG: hypothetical protein Q4D04_11645, partial [Clostridia bacterium]|nr:hypothetical protein [Clostridia bacterium]